MWFGQREGRVKTRYDLNLYLMFDEVSVSTSTFLALPSSPNEPYNDASVT